MRPITAQDIVEFYGSHRDLLVLTTDGEYEHIDNSDVEEAPYLGERAGRPRDLVDRVDGTEVQVLLTREDVEDEDWFEGAIDEDGNLDPEIAAQMAELIMSEDLIPPRTLGAIHAAEEWEKAQANADVVALKRARLVAELVDLLGGNQSEAGRHLGLNQSVVNRLVRKARTAGTTPMPTEHAPAL
ncbi:hypothetical protein [Streptomyces xiamenensis]|uniref:hypothetical protein n=1 Tax=Streptomyces xiamenensis TaxID=408015 RepID=UPI003D7180F8